MKTVSAIMTTVPVVANSSHKFSQVLRLFTEFPVHHLPIVDENDKLIGIISSNDIPKVFLNLCSQEKPVAINTEILDKEINITSLMTPNPVTIASDEPVVNAAKIFSEKKFMALPVVDNGVLVGILSLKDVVRHLTYSYAVAE